MPVRPLSLPTPRRVQPRAWWLCTPLLCALAVAHEGAASLEHCRDLRQSEPRHGAQACEEAARALSSAGAAEAAFEAWMHASELASQLGEPARAEAALGAAIILLPQVSDPLAAQRLARRRGLNAYRDGQPVQALTHFLEALAAARAAGDEGARAISENDLGVTYRHLGNYEAALAAFEASLALRESNGETNLAALLANIGSLYLELGDLPRAEQYLQRALDEHQAAGRILPAERTREELARLALRQGKSEIARALLEQAWQAYQRAQSPRDLQRLALLRARQSIEAGDRAAAAMWLEHARGARGSEEGDSLDISLVAARLAEGPEQRRQSYAALSAALADGEGHTPRLRIDALEQMAALTETLGQPNEAIAHLRRLHVEATALSEARHGERFDGMRVRFDVERLEAEAARRESELAKRRLETASVAAAGLLALALLGLYWQRRFYRQRLSATRERKALEQRIAEARKAAEDLRCDLRSMAWLLDRQQSACLVFDAAGRIRAATAAAARMLGREASDLQGTPLGAAVDPDTAQWAQARIESASLSNDREDPSDLGRRELSTPVSTQARCQLLSMEEELGVLLLEPLQQEHPADTGAQPSIATARAATDARADAAPTEDAEGTADAIARQEFRRLLVRLMRTALEAWERVSRKGRVELAEASGIWRITIDDGRLRVRAMDRYLSLDTLPERPRWREVLRTAYFLLGEVDIAAEHRQLLESLVEDVLQLTRPQL